MSFMRVSKFRHVFGKPLKKDQCYDALRISRSSWDSKFCAVSTKFVAVITESGGGSSFIVLPLSKVGRLDINTPQVSAHKGPIYDIAWCPHDDSIIASCADDCSIKLWQIPDEGLTETMTEPIVELCYHQKRVTSLVWHPTASDILLSTGSDNQVIVWDVSCGEIISSCQMPDQIYSMSFNEDGSLFACTCKDKKLRIVDSHTCEILTETLAHEGTKPPQCAFLKDNKVFTTGFSRMSERQYALWDFGKNSLEMMERQEIDSSNGVMFIFYDPDTSMVYLAGKGDSQVRFYEVTKESPYVHFLNLYTTNQPQKGMGYMPKRGVNVKQNEIARFYKLHNNGLCEVIPFIVPRKSELFQDDLYPDTASITPAISASDFAQGKNGLPVLMSWRDENQAPKREGVVVRKSNFLERKSMQQDKHAQDGNKSSNGAAEAPSAPSAAAAPTLPPQKKASSKTDASGVDFAELRQEINELKKKVSHQDKRIEELEGRVAQLEKSNHTDEEEGDEEAAA